MDQSLFCRKYPFLCLMYWALICKYKCHNKTVMCGSKELHSGHDMDFVTLILLYHLLRVIWDVMEVWWQGKGGICWNHLFPLAKKSGSSHPRSFGNWAGKAMRKKPVPRVLLPFGKYITSSTARIHWASGAYLKCFRLPMEEDCQFALFLLPHEMTPWRVFLK